jgi:hypothetical protein
VSTSANAAKKARWQWPLVAFHWRTQRRAVGKKESETSQRTSHRKPCMPGGQGCNSMRKIGESSGWQRSISAWVATASRALA